MGRRCEDDPGRAPSWRSRVRDKSRSRRPRRGGIVQRHAAADAYVLPHQIDHEANLRPLAEQGVDRVLAISRSAR